jgi:hypothetical protein
MCINLALKTKIEFPGNYEHPFSGNEAFPPYPTYSRTWNQTKLCSFEEEEGNRHREEKKAPESEETLKGPSLATSNCSATTTPPKQVRSKPNNPRETPILRIHSKRTITQKNSKQGM